jgi:hypothetical protein
MWHTKKQYAKSSISQHQGYTIIEVMIFLAVSSVLAFGALLLIGGEQAKTEFSQATRDLDLRLQDIINDVSTGYYINTGDFSCRDDGSKPVIEPGSNQQGQNLDCIVVGQVVEFGVDGSESIRQHTVVGLRQTGNPKEDVESLVEARPRAASDGVTNSYGTTTEKLQNGLKIYSVKYNDGVSGWVNISSIGFLTDFSSSSGGSLSSGSTNADLYPVIGTDLASAGTNQTPARIELLTDAMKNPSGGVIICMESTAKTSSYATITIGSNGRQLSTNLQMRSGDITADAECA